MKKTLVFFVFLLLSPMLIWSSPWAIVVNLGAGTIQTFDLGVNPPRMYGPFLSGTLGAGTISVTVTADNHYALVANYPESKLLKIDVSDPTSPVLAGTITLGGFYPEDIAVSPNGQFAVVSDGYYASEYRIAIVNLSTSTASLYTLATPGGRAQAAAIANDNQTVILCDTNSNRIIYGKVNAALTGLVSENVLSTDPYPCNVTVSPDGTTALVACVWSNCVNAFRIASDGVLSPGNNFRISGFHDYPQSIAFAPDGLKAYVFCIGSRETLAWLRVNGPNDVSLGGERVADLYSYSNFNAFYGVNQIAVSPKNDLALAGCSASGSNSLPASNSWVSLISLPNLQSSILAGSQYDGVGVATFNIYKPALTILAGAGGTTSPAPGSYAYDKNSVVSVQASANSNYRFLNWTGDASGSNNPVSITMDRDKTITANFIRRYTLTITAGAGGTTNPAPGTYTYDEGASVSIQAQATAASRFDSWSGDASGSANPVTVVMNGNKSVQANFVKTVLPPLSLTGERLANRNVSRVESVARLRWQANPANTGTVTYRVYQIENGQATKVADVAAGTVEYLVRKLDKAKSYVFGVVAVNSLGGESDLATVAIQ
jgi:hypothetical protein